LLIPLFAPLDRLPEQGGIIGAAASRSRLV
jgi:hypothetical protein